MGQTRLILLLVLLANAPILGASTVSLTDSERLRLADLIYSNAPPGWLTQPMSLADALNLALRQNTEIVSGRSDLEAAHGLAVETRAIALPKVRVAADYLHNEAVETSPFILADDPTFRTPEDMWAGSIRVLQRVYEGGRLRSAVRSARLLREQALLQYESVVADSLLAVRIAYYRVLLAAQEIVVQEASVNLLTEELKNTTRRFEAGAVPHFDVLRAEVELASAQPKLITARNDYRLAKNDLVTIVGYKVPTNVWDDIPLTLTGKLEAEPYQPDLAKALALGVERRPELGVLGKDLALQTENLASAKAGYKPAIGIFGGYGAHSSEYHSDLLWTVNGGMAGVEMTWDLFDGNLTRGKVMQASALRTKAGVKLDGAVRRVEQEVRAAYSSFIQAREVLESQKKVQERAEEALRLATSRYDAGSSTQLDVLNAQTALTAARTTQVEALHGYVVARARLDHAVGLDVPQAAATASWK
jgi:outer membrane protein TolC